MYQGLVRTLSLVVLSRMEGPSALLLKLKTPMVASIIILTTVSGNLMNISLLRRR